MYKAILSMQDNTIHSMDLNELQFDILIGEEVVVMGGMFFKVDSFDKHIDKEINLFQINKPYVFNQ